MADNFDKIIDHLILTESGSKNYRAKTSEGIWGFVNNPFDSGGATIHGVTFRNWKLFMNIYKDYEFFNGTRWDKFHSADDKGYIKFNPKSFTLNDFKALQPSDVKFFYYKEYWEKVSAERLPNAVDYYVFDFSVHSGPEQASKILQRIVDVVDDGVIGDRTIAAVNEYVDNNGAKRLIKEIDRSRREFLKRLKNNVHFLRGWYNRLEIVLSRCYELLGDVYIDTQKPVSQSRTINTAKNQTVVAASGIGIASIAPDEDKLIRATESIVENLETVNTITGLINKLYSYGFYVVLFVMIGFAGYQVYLRNEDWFTGKR